MEFRIEVTPVADPAGWQVRVFDVGAGEYLKHPVSGAERAPRLLRRVDVDRRGLKFTLPLPSKEEAEAIAPTEAHR